MDLFPILGSLLLIAGLLLLLAAVIAWLRAYLKYSTWTSASGTVTGVVSHSIRPSDFHYYPVIEFETHAGKIVSFESAVGFYPAKHKQGQVVSVWYDENNPDNATLDLAAAKWTGPLALGIFGVIALAIGGLILYLI